VDRHLSRCAICVWIRLSPFGVCVCAHAIALTSTYLLDLCSCGTVRPGHISEVRYLDWIDKTQLARVPASHQAQATDPPTRQDCQKVGEDVGKRASPLGRAS